MEGIDTKFGRLVIPIVAIAAVVVLGIVAPSLVTNAVLASEPAPEDTPTPTPTPEPTPEPAPTRTPTVPTAPADATDAKAQPGGLFSEVEGDPPPSSGVETLASRLVEIDFGQLARVTKPPDGPQTRAAGKTVTPQTIVLNLFDDAVFTGIVEHIEQTSSGHALWGRLDGVELGTMTLVVNGSVVTGTVRTLDAVYTIRTAGGGAYVIRQIDESSLPPLGEPLQAPLPTPDASQGVAPTPTSTPNGTSTPTPTPTPTVPTAPSNGDARKAQPGGLFSEGEGDPPPSPDVETLASRLVGIDFGQLARVTKPPDGSKTRTVGKPPTPQTLVLNLFDDVVFTGIVEHVEPTSSGRVLWGRLDGVELGTMTLVVNGSVVAGTVRTPEAVYTIRTVGDGKYVIRQIDESTLPPLGEPLVDSVSPRDPRPQSDDVPPDDGSVIDVLVVYTPLAKSHEGGRAAMEALIDLFVAETNQAYANSGVTHRIRLVMRDEVRYSEYIEEADPDIEMDDHFSAIDLFRLRRASDGYMDHVHELRDLYGADLIHLITGSGDVGGIAYSDEVGDDSHGFAVTLGYTSSLVFAHELGHNMGLRHDRYQALRESEQNSTETEGFNYGYVNQGMFVEGAPESANWRTIMAYGTQCRDIVERWCARLPYFSNPQKTYNGDPMGVPADHPSMGADGPADAVRAMNENRHVVANYRRSAASSAPRVGLTMSPYWLSEDGGVSTVTATLSRASSADTVVTVSASPTGTVALSENRTLTIPAGRTVSVDSVTITGVDNDDRTGDVSVTVSAEGSNPGVIEPEPVELAVADDETTPAVTLSLSSPEIIEGEGWVSVNAALDNRSSVETTVVVSASPAEFVKVGLGELGDVGEVGLLVIPAGQTSSSGWPVPVVAVDDDVLTRTEKRATVSGTATNSQGVTGPESVILTINDDERPIFREDSVSYTFTAGILANRILPEAAHGNGPLTYSISSAAGNGVTFTSGPPAQIGISAASVVGGPTTHTITATDSDGDTDTMTVTVTVRSPVCPGSAAASGAAAGGMVADCEALLSARDTLAGGASLNWSEDVPIAEWDGVSAGGGRVTEIGFFDFDSRLSGQIPSELGSLSNLRSLFLGGNQLSGPIPPELGSLTNLEHLTLWDNELTGEIPAELGSLTNLQSLGLGGNRLTGEIPAELVTLTNLEGLYLADNELSGPIPAQLGSLANLQWLELQSNELTGRIPAELGGLVNLRSLQLHRNQLTGPIPASLGGLTNLEELYLRGNRLTGCIPGTLSNVDDDDLGTLGLPFCGDHACVSGGAVTDAGNPELVSDCDTLLAARDTLAGTAALNWSVDTPIAEWDGVSLGGTPLRVTGLKLSGHGLSGEIPAELGSLSELGALLLQDNQLSGLIPAELGDLDNLQELYLGGNPLTGCVPDELRDVPNNDLTSLGLPFCSEHPCVSGGAVADTTNLGLMSDCVTLLASRDTLAGTATLNWAADTLITQWDGVTVDGTPQRVTELNLNDWGLQGEIPTELGKLSNLSSLQLIANQLTGEIPTELGKLSNLRWLLLWENRLTGEIPTELGELSNLRVLSLSSNQLKGEIPAELGALSNLTELYLSSNQLKGEIPVQLSSLNNLRQLDLDGNQLMGEIPEELGDLANLRSLDLSGNQLERRIPVELGSLNNLQILRLNENLLTGEIPMKLGNLSELLVLDLPSNQLTGEIPMELGKLSNLEVLSLWGNRLTGEIPTELEELSNLRTLWLDGNQLTGCIPPGLREVANNDLASLSLPFCDAPLDDCVTGGAGADATNTGLVEDCEALLDARDTLAGSGSLNWSEDTPITDWDGVTVEGTPRRVTRLDLRNKGLTGSIPPEIGNLAALEELILSSNQLSGPIPIEMGSLANLQWLFLSGNQLSGPIPFQIGRLANLQSLSFSINRLTGPIPAEMGALSNLEFLFLWGNQLTGALPQSFTGLTALQRFTFYSNLGICAPVDNAFQTWLQSIDIVHGSSCAPVDSPEDRAVLVELHSSTDGANWANSSNWLSDRPIREWHGVTSDANGRVTGLYLFSNQLTGAIPPELGSLSNLEDLILSFNLLTGAIPLELGSLSNLQNLYLPSNQLDSAIPSELGSLSNLERLSLADNKLTGPIPVSLGNLSNLKGLFLSINKLTGPIPVSLGDLSNLERLSLSNNLLTGPIPSQLDSLALELIYLSGNQLTGCIPAGLRDVPSNDFDQLGLPFCAALGREALVALYNATDGANWTNNTNWLSGGPIGEWYGVSVDSNGRVTNLDLNGLGLDGILPGELSDLTELKELYLQDNDLSGPIPPELGHLSDLTHLHLQNNDLSGGIPGDLGSLTVLRELRLDSNDLSGQLPPELSKLTKATRLWVADNDLSGPIPAELGDMANLDWLNLGRNNFSGQIPAELGNLSRLRRLYIYENDLSGPIPGALGSLSRLTHIVAQSNDLSGEIPAELGSLTNLVWLGLYDNDLSGEIPAELGGLAKLQRLYLTNNELYGEVPEELGDLAALTNLWLNHNYLSGQIPESLDNLEKLSRLRLAGNRFTGCLPAGLASVRNSDADQLGLETCAGPAVRTAYDESMETLGAVEPRQTATGDCATGGAVPDATNNPGLVSDCQALLESREALVGSAGTATLNWLADTPISEWDGIGDDSLEGSPPRVTRLYLNGLGLDGTLPSKLSDMVALKELYLHDNDLSGTIPPELGELSSLTHLHLQNNDLTGGIPAELGDLAVLRELRLDSNDLTGQLPPELGKLTRVTRLWVADNDLSGPIPAELGDMANLDWLNLGRNNFSGQISRRAGQPVADATALHLRERPVWPHTRRSGQLVAAHAHSGPVQRPERRDTCGVGQPDEPGVAWSLRQRPERRDTGRVGRSYQAAAAVPDQQRVVRGDTGGAWRPGITDQPVAEPQLPVGTDS